MGLFRRDKPLHEQLAESAGDRLESQPLESYLNPRLSHPALGPSAAPPEHATADERAFDPSLEPIPDPRTPWWHPEGPTPSAEIPVEAGMFGAPRARRWDVVTTAEAPLLVGDHASFVALDDGTLIIDQDEPEDALGPLADAVEASIPPPYRAAAVRNSGSRWGVSAFRIVLVEIRDFDGDQAELVANGSDPTLTVDGRVVRRRIQELERAGEAEGATYVVRAARVDGDLWQVEVLAL